MDTKVKSTVNPQRNQPKVDCQSVEQEKAPVFRVQTGMQAGGFYDRFYDWWSGFSAGFNEADQSTGLGG